jgi:hypothetical protein
VGQLDESEVEAALVLIEREREPVRQWARGEVRWLELEDEGRRR